MTSLQKIALTHVCLLIALLPMLAQSPKPAMSAPIPAPILAAKKIFIANAGTEQPWDEGADFSGGADRAYSEFYAAMKAWGRYELADSPAGADLLFEIHFTCPAAVADASRVQDSLVGRLYDPQFRLVIRDTKTSALLWTFFLSARSGPYCAAIATKTST